MILHLTGVTAVYTQNTMRKTAVKWIGVPGEPVEARRSRATASLNHSRGHRREHHRPTPRHSPARSQAKARPVSRGRACEPAGVAAYSRRPELPPTAQPPWSWERCRPPHSQGRRTAANTTTPRPAAASKRASQGGAQSVTVSPTAAHPCGVGSPSVAHQREMACPWLTCTQASPGRPAAGPRPLAGDNANSPRWTPPQPVRCHPRRACRPASSQW